MSTNAIDLAFTRPAFYDQALCRTVGPARFYPERGESAAAAVTLCRACPVREDCLNFAIDRGEPFGYWGGFSARERGRMGRVRRRRVAS